MAKKKQPRGQSFFFNLLLLVSLVVFVLYLNNWRWPSLQDWQYLFGQASIQGLEGPVRLVRVSDGDTLVVEINGREESVRLIGVDTPEKFSSYKLERDVQTSGLSKETLQRLGKQASAITENLVDTKRLYLEFDIEERDRYRRLLVYVFYPDADGDYVFAGRAFKQLNLELVKAGWAEPLTIPPNVRYAEAYLAASQIARAEDRGMWAERP